MHVRTYIHISVSIVEYVRMYVHAWVQKCICRVHVHSVLLLSPCCRIRLQSADPSTSPQYHWASHRLTLQVTSTQMVSLATMDVGVHMHVRTYVGGWMCAYVTCTAKICHEHIMLI